jgi:hypothetical protein
MCKQWKYFLEYKKEALKVAPIDIANFTILYKILKYVGSKICGR